MTWKRWSPELQCSSIAGIAAIKSRLLAGTEHHRTGEASRGKHLYLPKLRLPTIVVPSFKLLMPRPKPGESVAHLPPEVERIYEEARSAFQAAAFYGVRHAVSQAPYEYRCSSKAERDGVSEIKKLGNEANHELPPISDADAADILDFTVMLLKTIYDYPGRMRSKASP
ncbi:hypothetical protein U1Q18_052064 [Sarracenia purpurea var. burkii]